MAALQNTKHSQGASTGEPEHLAEDTCDSISGRKSVACRSEVRLWCKEMRRFEDARGVSGSIVVKQLPEPG